MAALIHTFRRPVNILRYIPQSIEWHKAEYRALHSHLPEWDDTVVLENGIVREGRLVLQQNIWEKVTQVPTDTLLLRGLRSADWLTLWPQRHRLPHFLQLHRDTDTQEVWVSLRDDYYPLHGSFKRDAFDIAPLLPGHSLAIDINARYWHSMMGRSMDTHYVEEFLYLEHLGVFEQAELVENLSETFRIQPGKRINLRKMMY